MGRDVISKELIDELGVILEQEFNIKLDSVSLNHFANFLVTYFQILIKNNNHK